MGLKTAFGRKRRQFVALITRLRKASGLTQVEVAARLGTDQSTYSKIEKGVRRMDVVEFVAWAEAIGAEPSDVLAELRRTARR